MARILWVPLLREGQHLLRSCSAEGQHLLREGQPAACLVSVLAMHLAACNSHPNDIMILVSLSLSLSLSHSSLSLSLSLYIYIYPRALPLPPPHVRVAGWTHTQRHQQYAAQRPHYAAQRLHLFCTGCLCSRILRPCSRRQCLCSRIQCLCSRMHCPCSRMQWLCCRRCLCSRMYCLCSKCGACAAEYSARAANTVPAQQIQSLWSGMQCPCSRIQCLQDTIAWSRNTVPV